ncbi:ABC transporter ATP-binding protein [Deltaproteobacteria bacterium]|nr:ABC transporter ATP-binding protein [Deltaproteobacteria bacterium]
MSLLHVNDLAVGFAAGGNCAPAVDGVSFNLNRGETLALVGESGCGKSAAALSLLRLIPNPPGKILRGEVWFEDRDLMTLSEKEIAAIRGNRIGMVFQEPMTALNPVMRIGAQIAEPLRLHRGMRKKDALALAADLLNEVGIPRAQNRLRDFPHQLSGGMRQRVVIAMAVACEPDVVIADEPTTALDVTVQQQVFQLLMRVTTQQGRGLLLISHDLGVVYDIADSVAVMYAGKIVEQAKTASLFANPKHPYTRGLMLSRPRLNAQSRHERLPSIRGVVPSLDKRPAGCLFRDRCDFAAPRCENSPPFAEAEAGHFTRCWLG